LTKVFSIFNGANQDCSYHLLAFLQKIVVTHILVFVYVTECKIVISEEVGSDEVHPKIAADADNSPSENLI